MIENRAPAGVPTVRMGKDGLPELVVAAACVEIDGDRRATVPLTWSALGILIKSAVDVHTDRHRSRT